MATTIAELQGLVSVVKWLSDGTKGLRMPSMQLPSFRRNSVVQDDISEFLE